MSEESEKSERLKTIEEVVTEGIRAALESADELRENPSEEALEAVRYFTRRIRDAIAFQRRILTLCIGARDELVGELRDNPVTKLKNAQIAVDAGIDDSHLSRRAIDRGHERRRAMSDKGRGN